MQEVDIPLTSVRRATVDGRRPSSISLDTASTISGSEPSPDESELERTLGLWSGMAIVIGTIIGSGIFSTPSLILTAVGSVGMSMAVWVLGAAVSVCGCIAYMELGTMLPRSGGEKEYLDTAFPRPQALMPFVFCLASLAICSPSALAADSAVTGTYFLYAVTGKSADHAEWAQRLLGVAVAVFCAFMHGFFVRWAIRLQSALTVVKVLVLLLIVLVGLGVGIRRGTHSFDSAFAGTSAHPSAYVSALFKVFFAYSGYTALNYSIDELKSPVRNLPRAALGGLLVTAVLYVLSNAAYFMVLDPQAVEGSSTAVAGVFFTEAFGALWGQRIVPVLIGLATLGNVMCGMFSASRVVFEAAREGYLPLGHILGEISRFQSPLSALCLSCALTVVFIVTPPAGEAYAFLIDIGGYPLWLFYGLAVVGLLVMRRTHRGLQRPFKAWHVANAVTLACAVFMCVVPFVRPEGGTGRIPYWAAPVAALAFMAVSCAFWYVQVVLRGGLERSRNKRKPLI
ncbi:hypothetical protein IWW40_005603 [Coemansia sp. RSA 1250]|nr:hypothetical protein IWW40_005603 [Coemansia sp. RSA 1250]